MSKVKWVDDKHLIPKTQPDLYALDGRRLTEVIPIADLAEVVEGLQCAEYALSHPGSDQQFALQAVQRLLALMDEVTHG